MEVLNPNEIGVKISTLILESDKSIYAVSPYIDLSKWKKILISLERAQQRGVSIKIFFREINDNDFSVLKNLGVELIEVDDHLHTKLYINERESIVSSMNLYEYSDIHSIDIGLHFKNENDYSKIYDYFYKYIFCKFLKSRLYVSKEYDFTLNSLHEYLTNRFPDAKISNASSYLFSKKLIHVFDVFIKLEEVSLKCTSKKFTIELIKDINEKMNCLKGYEVVSQPPKENYDYWIWDIKIRNKSNSEFCALFLALKNIFKQTG